MGIPPIGVVREAQNTMKLCKLFKNLYKNVMGTTGTIHKAISQQSTQSTIMGYNMKC